VSPGLEAVRGGQTDALEGTGRYRHSMAASGTPATGGRLQGSV